MYDEGAIRDDPALVQVVVDVSRGLLVEHVQYVQLEAQTLAAAAAATQTQFVREEEVGPEQIGRPVVVDDAC